MSSSAKIIELDARSGERDSRPTERHAWQLCVCWRPFATDGDVAAANFEALDWRTALIGPGSRRAADGRREAGAHPGAPRRRAGAPPRERAPHAGPRAPHRDADSVQFPREGPGLDYALNWSLCGDGVVPSKLAYRITKVQTAEQLLGGPPKAPAGAGAAAAAVDDDDAFDDAFDEAATALEATDALYVAEGDAPGTRTPCRVISGDLGLAATAMAHCLERMPLRAPTELPVTLYVAPSCADYAGAVVEDARLKIVLCGAQATAASVKASLAAAPAMLEAATAPVEDVDEAA